MPPSYATASGCRRGRPTFQTPQIRDGLWPVLWSAVPSPGPSTMNCGGILARICCACNQTDKRESLARGLRTVGQGGTARASAMLCRAKRNRFRQDSNTAYLPLQQFEHVLRRSIGLRHGRDGRLFQNLRLGQVRCLGGYIGIPDIGLRGRYIRYLRVGQIDGVLQFVLTRANGGLYFP